MENTVIGMFDSYAQAENAYSELLAGGFSRSDIQLDPEMQAGQSNDEAQSGGVAQFLSELFGMTPHQEKHDIYSEAMRRGSCILVVTVEDDQQRLRAEDILRRCHAVDIEERAEQWRTEGWGAHEPNAAVMTQGDLAQERSSYMQDISRGLDAEAHEASTSMHLHPQDHDHRLDAARATQSKNQTMRSDAETSQPRQVAEARGLTEGSGRIPTEQNLHALHQPGSATAGMSETRRDDGSLSATTAGEPSAGYGGTRTDLMDTMDTMEPYGDTRATATMPGGRTDMMDTREVMGMKPSGGSAMATGDLTGGSMGAGTQTGSTSAASMSASDLTGGSMGADMSAPAGDDMTRSTGARSGVGNPGSSMGGNMMSNASMDDKRLDDASPQQGHASLHPSMEAQMDGGQAMHSAPMSGSQMMTSSMPDLADPDNMLSDQGSSMAPAMTSDDSDFREHWRTAYGQSGTRYEDFDSAYRYGSTVSGTQRFQNYRWSELEPQLRSEWEASHPESAWDQVKDAVRYAVERVSGQRH